MKKFKIFETFLYVLLTCFAIVLFGVGIWILIDPAINVLYYNLTMEGSFVPNSSNLWIIFIFSYISIVLGLLLLFTSITMIVGLKNLTVMKIILLINFALIILALSCLILLAKSNIYIKPLRLRDVLTNVFRYKTANYQASVDNQNFMNTIQTTVGCCGEINADVYFDNRYIPVSCKGFLGIGCVEKTLDYINTRINIYRGILGMTFILQIIALIAWIRTLVMNSSQDNLRKNQNMHMNNWFLKSNGDRISVPTS